MPTLIKVRSGYAIACTKCAGTGFLAHYAYESEGTCFQCAGRGIKNNAKVYASPADAEKHLVKLEKARIAREAKRDAQRKAEFEAQAPQRLAAEAEHQRLVAEVAAQREAQEFLPGGIGEFVAFSGTVLTSFSVETKFGKSVLTKVQSGNAIVKFFSTASFAYDLSEGDNVSLIGEIVSRDVYQGDKETLVKKTRMAA